MKIWQLYSDIFSKYEKQTGWVLPQPISIEGVFMKKLHIYYLLFLHIFSHLNHT